METRKQYNILDILKALADESRLALLRLLNEKEQTVGELARQVGLGDPTVSHHLARLRQAGLVTLRMAGNQRFYRINEAGLAAFKKLAAEIEQAAQAPEAPEQDEDWIAELGWDAADQKVLRDYTRGGVLTRLPSKQKKLNAVLRWLSTLFAPDRLYSEADVNEILKSKYEQDFVSLRRDLVDLGYLRREKGGGTYWKG